MLRLNWIRISCIKEINTMSIKFILYSHSNSINMTQVELIQPTSNFFNIYRIKF